MEQQLSAQKNQEKQIQQTERLIEKFRAKSSKASMAQSLIKKLDKIESDIASFLNKLKKEAPAYYQLKFAPVQHDINKIQSNYI